MTFGQVINEEIVISNLFLNQSVIEGRLCLRYNKYIMQDMKGMNNHG